MATNHVTPTNVIAPVWVSFSSSLDPKDYLEKVVKVEHEDGLTWLVKEEGKRYGFRDGSPTKLLVSDKPW